MTEFTPAEYHAYLRTDLSAVIARTFLQLNPHIEFKPNWHFDLIASKLQATLDGRCKRLIINIPPRNGKSISVSVAFVAFLLGHRPGAHVISVTYGQKLSEKNARDLRAVVKGPWYQEVFKTRISSDKQAVDEFVTTAGGSYLATSVGGMLTGRGGDFIIIDDPLKPDDATSDGQRQAVNDWYDGTLVTRLNDKQAGCIIIIMQRLHEDDLVGHVLRQEQWDVISLPAIAEEDEEHAFETPFGARMQRRKQGEALHPDREPLDVLAALRMMLGEYNFSGQYQQRPAPMGGGLVRAEWMKTYTDIDRPKKFDVVLQSWDTASKASELSDYSVCTTWGITAEKKLYLLDVFRKKVLYPELKRAVLDLAVNYEPDVIVIEDKGSGMQLIQELHHEGFHSVKAYKPVVDKKVRLSAQTGFFESGSVYLPKEAHWRTDYIHELTIFPNAKHDDQVDSTAQALDWYKHEGMSSAWAWIEFYKQEALKAGCKPQPRR